MPWWKTVLLALYYHGTRPARAIALRSLAAAGRAPVIVLNYHRVADDRANVWTCSHRWFEAQVRWLAGTHDMVSLEEAQRRIRDGNDRPAAHVSFDDGYAENCARAIPLLERLAIPYTYFVTSGNVLSGQPFAHDVAMGNRFAPNTLDELKRMADRGAEIGHHTRTHSDLGPVTDRDVLVDEIVTSGRELAGSVGRPVRYFAFAYGQPENISDVALDVARSGGYLAAMSNYGGYNIPRRDPFHVKRHHVLDGLVRLQNHARLDPRKLGVGDELVWTAAAG